MTPAPPITQTVTVPITQTVTVPVSTVMWQPCTCNWTWLVDFSDGLIRTVPVRRPGLTCTQQHLD